MVSVRTSRDLLRSRLGQLSQRLGVGTQRLGLVHIPTNCSQCIGLHCLTLLLVKIPSSFPSTYTLLLPLPYPSGFPYYACHLAVTVSNAQRSKGLDYPVSNLISRPYRICGDAPGGSCKRLLCIFIYARLGARLCRYIHDSPTTIGLCERYVPLRFVYLQLASVKCSMLNRPAMLSTT
jgi:hypothetical protein